MSGSNTPDPAATTPGGTAPEANGHAAPADLRREEYRLWVQCAKLRNWCRDLLGAEGSEGALPPEVVRELADTPPGMTTDEVMEALRVLAFGEPVPTSGPWHSRDATRLAQRVADLAAERERLRQVFFTLLDSVFPEEAALTDEYFQEIADQPPGPSISEMLDELEREIGGAR